MTTAVIELHDVALRCGTGNQFVEEPGHALVTPQGIVTGAAARARAWREPQHSFDQYWQQLGTAALPVASRHARHFADLAHAQLLALHQAAGAPARVVLAVPGSFGRDQLALLLGIAQAAPFSVVGLIDAALAAAHTEVADTALHIDLLRHCAVLTSLRRSAAEVVRDQVVVLPELGINRLHELWARHLAERFIAAHRYDPLHTGSGEQALRDALPGWLATLARQPELNVTLAGPRGPLQLALTTAELVAVAEPVYSRLEQAGAAAGTGPRLLAAGGLPGLRARLSARPVLATASIAGSLAQLDVIAARPANVLITRLPAATTTPAPVLGRPPATHLLWRHRAHDIGTGLALHQITGALAAGAPAGADTDARLERDGTRLQLRGTTAGVAIEGDAADLRAGDRLRIGGEVLELIQVLASAEAP